MYVHKNKDQYTKRKIQTPKNIDFRFLLARSQNYEKWLLNSQYFFLRPSAISEKSVHARRIYMTFDIELFFEWPSGKLKFHYVTNTITCTLYDDHYTVAIIYLSLLLRMRNFCRYMYREIKNTHFAFNKMFSESSVFVRLCIKLSYCQTRTSWL